jgi:hypothetical protein
MRTNIRYYDLACFAKLLNITLLHEYGYKISMQKLCLKKRKESRNQRFRLAMMILIKTFQTYETLLARRKNLQRVKMSLPPLME